MFAVLFPFINLFSYCYLPGGLLSFKLSFQRLDLPGPWVCYSLVYISSNPLTPSSSCNNEFFSFNFTRLASYLYVFRHFLVPIKLRIANSPVASNLYGWENTGLEGRQGKGEIITRKISWNNCACTRRFQHVWGYCWPLEHDPYANKLLNCALVWAWPFLASAFPKKHLRAVQLIIILGVITNR